VCPRQHSQVDLALRQGWPLDKPRDLQPSDFESLVGQSFEMRVDDSSCMLQLKSLKLNKPHHMRAQPFELAFYGESVQPIPQGSYAVAHPALGEVELFMVPTAKVMGGFEYLVVFN
jgi:hypothetical protein